MKVPAPKAKPRRKALPFRQAWELPAGWPEEWTSEIVALQAFEQGIADEYQQRIAFKFVVNVLSNADAMTFHPGGADAERASCFAEGVRWVGRQMRMVARLKPSRVDSRDAPPPMPAQKSQEVNDA